LYLDNLYQADAGEGEVPFNMGGGGWHGADCIKTPNKTLYAIGA
jgi:hypothetical protein